VTWPNEFFLWITRGYPQEDHHLSINCHTLTRLGCSRQRRSGVYPVKCRIYVSRVWGLTIDIDAIVRVADLFRFRWDPAVLAVLAERPFRFRALHTRLVTQIGEHVDDNALTRSLHRLTRAGLIQADSRRMGSRPIKIYGLSDKGRVHLMKIEAIVCVFTDAHTSDDECDGKCRVHPGQDTDDSG